MGTRVLVVDDEPEICELVRVYLEAEGFEVETLGDGAAAAARVAYEHDSVHPWISFQISGFPQVINAVRMSSPSRGIPNRLVYERIFSAAKVVNSVVNLADLQLRTL